MFFTDMQLNLRSKTIYLSHLATPTQPFPQKQTEEQTEPKKSSVQDCSAKLLAPYMLGVRNEKGGGGGK